MEKYRIKQIDPKPFKDDDGQDVPYFWVKAERKDGVTIVFGTAHNEDLEVGEIAELELEKREGRDGRARWFRVV